MLIVRRAEKIQIYKINMKNIIGETAYMFRSNIIKLEKHTGSFYHKHPHFNI